MERVTFIILLFYLRNKKCKYIKRAQYYVVYVFSYNFDIKFSAI